MALSELKPCPLCGAPAEMDTQQAYRNISTARMETSVAIYCTACPAQVQTCRGDVPNIEPEAVIELWNSRALLDAARAEQKEDAEPVAWRYLYPLPGDKAVWRMGTNGREINGARPLRSEPLYTHPPRAEQPVMSREAVEAFALKFVTEQSECGVAPVRKDAAYLRDAILALASPGGEQEAVAWTYEYTNHLQGDRAPGGWLRAVAFEPPTAARVQAGFVRNVRALGHLASPVRGAGETLA